MAMKRSRENFEFGNLDMAKCLMLLSRSLIQNKPSTNFIKTTATISSSSNNNDNNMFECKTCNKKFSSFQALGGHRASHKRPRLLIGAAEVKPLSSNDEQLIEPKKPKMHECSICGVEFALGQALGGHMRRHRAAAMAQTFVSSAKNDENNGSKVPVMKRSGSCKMGFGLDLNLTPLENDLQYLFGKMAPKVNHVLI